MAPARGLIPSPYKGTFATVRGEAVRGLIPSPSTVMGSNRGLYVTGGNSRVEEQRCVIPAPAGVRGQRTI